MYSTFNTCTCAPLTMYMMYMYLSPAMVCWGLVGVARPPSWGVSWAAWLWPVELWLCWENLLDPAAIVSLAQMLATCHRYNDYCSYTCTYMYVSKSDWCIVWVIPLELMPLCITLHTCIILLIHVHVHCTYTVATCTCTCSCETFAANWKVV